MAQIVPMPAYELPFIVAELRRELASVEARLDALLPSSRDYEEILGRLAERRGLLVTQLTLMRGLARRARAAPVPSAGAAAEALADGR